MAKKSKSNLSNRAYVINNAQQDGENTAVRVGGLDVDIIDSLTLDFDPNATYAPGQTFKYKGFDYDVVTPYGGQPPISDPSTDPRFAVRGITDIDSLTDLNPYPVSGKVLKRALAEASPVSGGNVPNADTTTRGKVRQSTDLEAKEGANNDTYITPKQLKAIGGGGPSSDDLQKVAERGYKTTTPVQGDELKKTRKAVVQSANSVIVGVSDDPGVTRLEEMTFPALKIQLGTSVAEGYKMTISKNECDKIVGTIYNPASPGTAAVFKVKIDGEFIQNMTAFYPVADVATLAGIPLTSLIGFDYGPPVKYLDNLKHSITFHHITTDEVLQSLTTPGNCGIQATPNPVIVIDGIYIEKPANPGNNPPPTVSPERWDDIDKTFPGDYRYVLPRQNFQDAGDTLTYYAKSYSGNSYVNLPDGLVFDPINFTLFTPGTLPYGYSCLIFIFARDTAGQEVHGYFLFTANVPTNTGAYVIQRLVDNSVNVTEGGDFAYARVRERLSDNTDRYRTTNLKLIPRANSPYPNQLLIELDPATPGRYRIKVAANTIEKDGDLLLTFDLGTDGKLDFSLPMIDAPTPTATTCAVLNEIGFIINSLGTNGNPDSIGIYYKGTGKNYKAYLENTAVAGQFDLYNEVPNDAEVVLTGGLSRFNHRIVQAMATRSFRTKAYQFRLEIYSGTTLVISKTVIIGIVSPLKAGDVISLYTCS